MRWQHFLLGLSRADDEKARGMDRKQGWHVWKGKEIEKLSKNLVKVVKMQSTFPLGHFFSKIFQGKCRANEKFSQMVIS